MSFCKNPELACQVTLQPLARFKLDAAIIFSDILTVPDAMGCPVEFVSGEGPCFNNPIQSTAAVEKLIIPDVSESLDYVAQALKLTRAELQPETSLLGFAGSPWTVATYMVEGGSSKTFSIIKKMAYSTPQILHKLLSKISKVTTAYLNMQIQAGADAIMLFDTWGGVLAHDLYQEFSLNYMQQILQGLPKNIPTILFTKQAGTQLAAMAKTGASALGVDWTQDLASARQLVADKVALQGNLDPCVLYSNPETIVAAVKKALDSFGNNPGHIFNLGHGIYPDIPPENVAVMVDAVHEFSLKIRS